MVYLYIQNRNNSLMAASYQKYTELIQSIADINYAAALLGWDQETYMPVKGADHRARQLSTLAGLAHEKSTAEELGHILEELIIDPSLNEVQKNNIKHSLHNYRKSKKYNHKFVTTLSRTISEAVSIWQKAKSEANFKAFAPYLERLVELKKQECELLGYKDHPYDALLDEFEPGLLTKDVETLFQDVRTNLVPFVYEIMQRPLADDRILKQYFPKSDQFQLSEHLLRAVGYDFESGRQDISLHPFTVHFGAADVRVTTRIDENDLADMLTGTIHEGGHGLYEQGLPLHAYGLPEGEAVSLGIHESQSRLWENNVGRSRLFWKGMFPVLQNYFPDQFKHSTPDDVFRALNNIRPSLIRVNADELTYHFHIMVRFETEKALLEGSLQVKEIPEFWNSRIKNYLGLNVRDDASGCLQDVHWSHGSFGYFPTYSIGSFYAAQFYTAAVKQVDGLEEQIEAGKFSSLREWLKASIHVHGRLYTARELCERITGEPLNFRHFMDYTRKKYGALYAIE
jgi:carboxypeptidase Taq